MNDNNGEIQKAALRLSGEKIPPKPPREFEDGSIKVDLQQTVRKRWTVADLLNAEFPEPKWAIPGIFCEGLSIFGGRPKVGKSWMMLQAAWSVGTGGKFLDHTTKCGEVLYLALEDSPRRLQERIRSMGIARDALITFRNRFPPLHQKGMAELMVEIENTNYRMIVIDTLTRSIPGIDQKKDGGAVGRVFDELQRIAITRNLSIVLIDHTRKPSGFAADPIDDILHSTEKTAIADCILALYKQQGKAGANLLGRGRDIEDIEYSLEFDAISRSWQLDTPDLSENFDAILDALDVLNEAQLGDIAKAISEKNHGNLHKRIMRLVELGKVGREKRGRNVFFLKK